MEVVTVPEAISALPDTESAADEALLLGDEAPESETPDGAEAPPPEPSEAGQPRDPHGRFAPAAPQPETPLAPSLGTEPTAQPVVPAPSPFKYTADGQEIEVPGSLVDGEWLKIPPSEVPRITKLLSEGHSWNGSAQRYFAEANQRQQATEQRATKAEERIAAVEAERTEVLGRLEELIEASQNYPPERLLESPIGQWMLARQVEWPVLKAQAETRRIRQEAEADRQRLTEHESQVQEATQRPQIDASLSDYVLHFGGKAGLDRPAMEDIYATLKNPAYEGLWLQRADRDYPDKGVRKGERYINYEVIEQEVLRVSRLLAPFKAKTTTAAVGAVTTPAVPAPSRNVLPPTVSATRGPAPKKAAPAKPKSKEEADDWLLNGGPGDED